MAGHSPIRRRRPALLITAAVALMVFAGLAAVVATHPDPLGIDRAAARAVESTRADGLTGAMRAVSSLGSSPAIAIQIAAIGGAILLLRRDARTGLWLLAAFTGAWLLSNGFKALLDRPRPEPGLVDASGTSFPSGHATQGGAYFVMLGAVLASVLPRGWRGVGAAVAVLVGFLSGLSRIYLDVHWLTDVVGGFALGVAWATLLLAVRPSEGEPTNASDPG